MQNLVVASNKQSPLNPPGVPAAPKAYFLTPPPTVEHPERHWHTGDIDVDESDSDESEREHPDDTEHPERHWHTGDTDLDESDLDESERENPDDVELEGTDLSKTEKEKLEDTDVNESDSGNKDPYEDEDENHYITIIPRNDPQNPYISIISETPAEIDLIFIYSIDNRSIYFFMFSKTSVYYETIAFLYRSQCYYS